MSTADQAKDATTAAESTPQTESLNQATNKKRKTDKQLTKDDYEAEEEQDDRFGPSEPANDVVRADDDTLKQRKIVKVNRKGKESQESENGNTTKNGKEDKSSGYSWNFSIPSATTPAVTATPDKKRESPSNNISVTTPFKFDFSFTANTTGTESTGFGNFGSLGTGFSFGDFSNQKKDLEWKGSENYEPEEGAENPEQFEASYTPATKVQLSDEPVKSGEEEDKNICSHKVKLYRLTKTEKGEGEAKTTAQEWKEAGVGLLKINELANGKGRIIMRADPTLRLVLNSLIFSSITYKKNGDKQVIFSVFDEKLETQSYLAKFQKSEQASEFINTIESYKVKA